MTTTQEDTSPCTSEPLAAEAACEQAAYAEMNALDTQAELSDSDTANEQQQANPSRLVGAVQNGCYAIGVVRGEDFSEDGTFAIPTALVYTNIDSAIAALDEVLVHAKQVRAQLLYEHGISVGRAQVVAEQAQSLSAVSADGGFPEVSDKPCETSSSPGLDEPEILTVSTPQTAYTDGKGEGSAQ